MNVAENEYRAKTIITIPPEALVNSLLLWYVPKVPQCLMSVPL